MKRTFEVLVPARTVVFQIESDNVPNAMREAMDNVFASEMCQGTHVIFDLAGECYIVDLGTGQRIKYTPKDGKFYKVER